MPEELKLETFQKLLNAKFMVEDGTGNSVELELVEITVREHDARLEAFSLFFRGIESPYLPQGIKNFTQEKLGTVQIFITPLGPKNGGMQYEAAFNRFRKDAE